MGKHKKWQDLTIVDDYMFKLVMEHKRICKHLIECLLNIKIEDIIYLEKEKTVKNAYDSKGIRLDVYVQDEVKSRFLLEMQAWNFGKREIARRSRYYQSTIDFDFLHTGDNYENLGDAYVIFLCPFKLFDGKQCLYTYKSVCMENKELVLEDGMTKVFLSSCGKSKEGLHKDVVAFLAYMNGKSSNNGFVHEMEDTITQLKENKEKEAEYMMYSLRLYDERRIGREEGRTEGLMDMALKMLKRAGKKKHSLSESYMDEVSELTELPLEKVKELARQEGLI